MKQKLKGNAYWCNNLKCLNWTMAVFCYLVLRHMSWTEFNDLCKQFGMFHTHEGTYITHTRGTSLATYLENRSIQSCFLYIFLIHCPVPSCFLRSTLDITHLNVPYANKLPCWKNIQCRLTEDLEQSSFCYEGICLSPFLKFLTTLSVLICIMCALIWVE